MHPSSPAVEAKPIPDARLLARQGLLVTVSGPGALPQGTRVRFEIRPACAEPPVSLEGKVVSVRRLQADRFALAIRVHSLTRAESAALERALAAREEGGPEIDEGGHRA